MKLCILVTHLLGTGHLRRAALIGRAAVNAGAEVTIISGGNPVAGLDCGGATLVQLPPLRSDGVDFSNLLTEEDTPATTEYRKARATLIAAVVKQQEPDALLTELYPFGRRSLADEFLGAIQTARALARPAVIAASIRDILAPPSKPARATQTDEVIANCYDAVLVHSDARTVPLSVSWPVSDLLAPYLKYTGFVAPPMPSDTTGEIGLGEILVSAGGGAVARHMFATVLEAARNMKDQRFRLLIGGRDGYETRAKLSAIAPENVSIEGLRADFREMLTRASCSVSTCGYNTAMDILQTGIPALFVPFDDGNEVEQSLRANRLSHLDGIIARKSVELTPQTLNEILRRLCTQTRRGASPNAFDGASRSIEILKELADGRTT